MNRLNRAIWIGALLVALVAALSCEDTDVTAPSGSTITLTAQPQSVFIDQAEGENANTATLSATVVDTNGLPLASVPLFFTTTGGLLASIENFCKPDDTCSSSTDVCEEDADCPAVVPATIQTDGNGKATDLLKLRLIEDPSAVTVTVKGTNLEATAQVSKNVNLGPIDPVAVISASPQSQQRAGAGFVLSGANSTFDPQVELECFAWELSAADDRVFASSSSCAPCPTPENDASCSSECVEIGPDSSVLNLVVGSQDPPGNEPDFLTNTEPVSLTVILSVGDEPDPECTSPQYPYSIFNAILTYTIICDLTPPAITQIPQQFGDLDETDPVVINVTAVAFDPESNDLYYEWDCGNNDPNGQDADWNLKSFSCEYSSPENYAATVTVTNKCKQSVEEGFNISIVGQPQP